MFVLNYIFDKSYQVLKSTVDNLFTSTTLICRTFVKKRKLLTVEVVDPTQINSINSQTVNSAPLLHELQLGERLNKCVHQSRRADFALMLAMLCDDVREHSQFVLPNTPIIDGTATDKPEQTNQVLRKYFELPEEAPLALTSVDQISAFNQAQLVADKKLATLHLSNALVPAPLAFRDDDKHVNHSVLTNTTLVCQKKHAQQQANSVINKPLTMQVDSWLKAVQTSIVKSSLFDVVAA